MSKISLVAWLVLMLLGTSWPASAQPKSDSINASAETTLLELEKQLDTAVVQGDVKAFDRLFAEDFTHTSQDGRQRTKPEWMKGRIQGKTNYVSFDVDDRQIRVYERTAVVTGISKPTWREDNGTLASGRYRYLRVWTQREGRWQVVAFQSTRIIEGKE